MGTPKIVRRRLSLRRIWVSRKSPCCRQPAQKTQSNLRLPICSSAFALPTVSYKRFVICCSMSKDDTYKQPNTEQNKSYQKKAPCNLEFPSGVFQKLLFQWAVFFLAADHRPSRQRSLMLRCFHCSTTFATLIMRHRTASTQSASSHCVSLFGYLGTVRP